jgi:LPS-assembly lipoprotein
MTVTMPLRSIVFMLGMCLLSACGFHLRGSLQLPPAWTELHLASASPNSELSRALREGAERGGVNWRDRDAANFIITLGDERFERRNLTIGTNARAAEIELQMTASLAVTEADGTELMPATDLSTFKIITNDPENISGKVEEARLLRAEMREDLAQQMLRKMRFLATTAPGDSR